jgi:hypothetical protein
MAYRWETPASVWLEDEHSGQFALAASTGLTPIDWQHQLASRVPDLAHLLGASLPVSCHCSSIYPEGFAYCPTCGRALDKLAGQVNSQQPDWWGPWADQHLPRHVPQGLPVTSLALGDSLEQRPAPPAIGRFDVSMPAPPNAQCVFAAGSYGFPGQRLLALAYSRNVLQYWDPFARLWHVMAADEHSANLSFTMSSYGWLPVVNPRRGEVALVPTNKGLCRLWLNPFNDSYRTEPVFDAAIASAPGVVRRHLGCLFNAAGGLRLWTGHTDLSNVQLLDCPEAPGAGWSRPISYDGRLLWLHQLGQLAWQPGLDPQWLAWPQGWSPRLDFGGPTQSRDGRLWHIGHSADEGYSFLELGTRVPQQEPISGARLGFANLLFRRGHAVPGEPWETENVEDLHEDDSLVLPLLRSFNNHRSEPSGLVLRFHAYTGKAEEALASRTIARTTVEWIGKRNVILDELVRLSRPLECVPFVYDDCLWLHHPDWNQMRGWRLEALS